MQNSNLYPLFTNNIKQNKTKQNNKKKQKNKKTTKQKH